MLKETRSEISYKILKCISELRTRDIEPEIKHFYFHSDLLNINEGLWISVLSMLIQANYITGLKLYITKDGRSIEHTAPIDLTIEGTEYLEENKTMTKIATILEHTVVGAVANLTGLIGR